MARIAGVEVPSSKRIEIALTYIYGIGRATANEILRKADVNPDIKAKDLNETQINTIQSIIQKEYLTEGDLRRDVHANIRRLIEIGAYRGMRHRRNLPVRGQRTRTNARTRRGKRRTVGSVRASAKRLKEQQKT